MALGYYLDTQLHDDSVVMALAALRELSEISAVTVSTYQSVTGTGAAARAELLAQSRDMLANKNLRRRVSTRIESRSIYFLRSTISSTTTTRRKR